MPSFKAVVMRPRRNGERAVCIRLIHGRRTRHLPTGLVACDGDVRNGELVSPVLIDRANEIMKRMRDRCNTQGAALLSMGIDEVARIASFNDEYDRNFLGYCRLHLERMAREKQNGTLSVHRQAVKSLEEFMGRGLLFYDEMTTGLMREYREWLRGKGRRAPSLYFSTVASIYREAKRELNDTPTGEPRITRDPFAIVKPDRMPQTRKRALSTDEILRIRDFSAEGETSVARDMFMLSFYLAGINAADLFELKWADGGHVEYNRRKTRTRRADGAYMLLSVPDEARPILERYADRHGEYALDFCRRYMHHASFRNMIVKGMNRIGAALGIDRLTYYAARHSWATIAANECGVDIYTVEKALCHKPAGLSVTETYIKADYSRIDSANRRVLDYLEEAGL